LHDITRPRIPLFAAKGGGIRNFRVPRMLLGHLYVLEAPTTPYRLAKWLSRESEAYPSGKEPSDILTYVKNILREFQAGGMVKVGEPIPSSKSGSDQRSYMITPFGRMASAFYPPLSQGEEGGNPEADPWTEWLTEPQEQAVRAYVGNLSLTNPQRAQPFALLLKRGLVETVGRYYRQLVMATCINPDENLLENKVHLEWVSKLSPEEKDTYTKIMTRLGTWERVNGRMQQPE
jgi:hypothetical protein